jgi:hypothetical protein
VELDGISQAFHVAGFFSTDLPLTARTRPIREYQILDKPEVPLEECHELGNDTLFLGLAPSAKP